MDPTPDLERSLQDELAITALEAETYRCRPSIMAFPGLPAD